MSLTRVETMIKADLDTDNADQYAYSAWTRVEIALTRALEEAMAYERTVAASNGVPCPIRDPVLDTAYL